MTDVCLSYRISTLGGSDVTDVFGGDRFQESGLAGVVEAQQKNAHLLVRLALQLAQ